MTAYIEFSETEVKELVGKIPIETLSAIVESKTDNRYVIVQRIMLKDFYKNLCDYYSYLYSLSDMSDYLRTATSKELHNILHNKWNNELVRLTLRSSKI